MRFERGERNDPRFLVRGTTRVGYGKDMSPRSIAVAAFAILSIACVRPAAAAPTAPIGDPDVSAVNRRLATLVAEPSRPRGIQAGVMLAPGRSIALAPTNVGSFFLSPAVLSLAARFAKAEHLLHFQGRNGLDANLWGALNGGKGIRFRYVVRF
jgi:hypothetical protein